MKIKSDPVPVVMHGVTEYAEGMHVTIKVTAEEGREVIHAKNEGGLNGTEVDLEQLLEWLVKNRPAQYAKHVTLKVAKRKSENSNAAAYTDAVGCIHSALLECKDCNGYLPKDVDSIEQLALQYAPRKAIATREAIPYVCNIMSTLFTAIKPKDHQ